MASAAGVREGDFVKFVGWDLPGHDAASYPDLQGDDAIQSLKNIVLDGLDRQFYAFNTFGRVKACVWFLLSWPEFRQVSGCTLYIRVEYPGWHFFQGQDSGGNDLSQDRSTAAALLGLGKIDEKYQSDADNRRVAAVNTQGWIKKKVVFPLSTIPGPSAPSCLDGIYVRTSFRWFKFYPQIDSPLNDIEIKHTLLNDIPELIAACNSDDSAAGFNTNGWIKKSITESSITIDQSNFTIPTQGLYVRTRWQDFVFLPGLDSPLKDYRHATELTPLPDPSTEARPSTNIVAFMTNKLERTLLNNQPSEFVSAQIELCGIYVKAFVDGDTDSVRTTEAHPQEHNHFYNSIFIFMGSWYKWGVTFIADAVVRAQSIKRFVGINRGGNVTKPDGSSLRDFIYLYFRKIYNVAYKKFPARAEKIETGRDVIKRAGRASAFVTSVVESMGKLGKVFGPMALAYSAYQVAISDRWSYELGKHATAWVGTIGGAEIGATIGAFAGPVGSVFGGIVGSLIGGFASREIHNRLNNVFFSGSSVKKQMFILGLAHEHALTHANLQMRSSSRKSQSHLLLKSYIPATQSDNGGIIAPMVEDMVNTFRSPKDYEAIASNVWIVASDKMLPINSGSPKDHRILMNRISDHQSYKIDSGIFDSREFSLWPDWLTDTSKRINFARPYSDPPSLAVGLTVLDIDQAHNIRVEACAKNITAASFNAQVRTWRDTILYAGACNWLEVMKDDPDYQCGQFSTEQDHPWDKPQTNTSYTITFPTAYSSPPKVVLWLNKLDMAHNKDWRIKTFASDITRTGFKINIDTWGDTLLYVGAGSWVAYPAGKELVTSGEVTYHPEAGKQAESSSGYESYEKNFEVPPRVLVGITGFNFGCGLNLRLKIGATNVTRQGMNWHIETWSDSVMHHASLSYLAYQC